MATKDMDYDYPKRATNNFELDSDPDGVFNHQFWTDPDFRRQFSDKVAAHQRELPEWLQRELPEVALPGATPGQQVDAYNAYVVSRLADAKLLLRDQWQRLSIADQDRLEADGWQIQDIRNTEGRIDLRAAEGIDQFSAMEYGQLANRARTQRKQP